MALNVCILYYSRRQLTNGSLHITSMQSSLAGHYQCVATGDAGTVVSRVAILYLAGKCYSTQYLTCLARKLLDRIENGRVPSYISILAVRSA